ncbi:MAG: glutamate--tRNA ligase [Methanotrichaceae archaeon]|nr:glutamate--tRNA ligase [Methanotrichaceae archaeon]
MREIRGLIEKYALQNAVKYKAAPNAGAVMGKLMGEHTDLRSRAKEISPLVQDVLDEVSKMRPDEWQERLMVIAPELLDELSERKEPAKGLPPLEGAENGVIMRFAPNPNGPPTLGSARGIIVNSEYVKHYGGKFLIRFDDTDPVKKRPMLEAYGWYLEDCSWLGAEPDEVVIASERVHLYYDVAEELIRRNGAYVCQCLQTVFKEYKDKGIPCPHRDQTSEHNMDLWKRMLDGSFAQGQAVLRIKTDMNHKDPAIRDWPAFRIATTPHPKVGEKYRVWPLLDFESAVEDHLQEITHILRGKDLADSEKRQIYLYQHMNWTYPRVIHWGRVKIHQFGSFSTSKLRKAIENGEFNGWDDPRIPTVRALRSRGILAEALRKFMIELGVSETDIAISMDSIYAENRKLVDPIANRYFFVWDPVLLRIDGNTPNTAKALLHPNKKSEFREIPAGNEVFVCQSDLKMLKPGEKIRLKDLCNIEILSKVPLEARFVGVDVSKGLKIIHWAPKNGLPIRVLRPDGQDDGIGEVRIAQELGRVVQFERYGFVRIHQLGNPLLAYFTHK